MSYEYFISHRKMKFHQAGDLKSVKSSFHLPHLISSTVFYNSRGNLMQVKSSDIKDELSVVVDFPECRQWEGLYSEIELIPGCGFEVR